MLGECCYDEPFGTVIRSATNLLLLMQNQHKAERKTNNGAKNEKEFSANEKGFYRNEKQVGPNVSRF
jgi:hypothetical protein